MEKADALDTRRRAQIDNQKASLDRLTEERQTLLARIAELESQK